MHCLHLYCLCCTFGLIRRPARAALFGALFMALSACQKAPPLRLCINPWPGYEVIFLAQSKGLYAAAGVDVDIVQLDSLNQCRRAFERGQVDGMASTLIEVLQARELSDRKPQIVYVHDYSNGGDVVMAKNGIADIKALRGARVGFEPGTLNLYVLSRALARDGMSLDFVQPVAMAQSEMAQALIDDKVDAVVTYPPFSIALHDQQLAQTIFSTKAIPGEVLDVMSFDAGVLLERKQDIAKLLTAYELGLVYHQQHADEANALMAAREGISVDDFAHAITDDLRLLYGADQAGYFAGGKLRDALDVTQQVRLAMGEQKQMLSSAELIADQSSLRGGAGN